MKRILIIGATSAIAHACARIWAVDGHELMLVGRDAQRLASNAADLSARGAGLVKISTLDVLDIEGQKEMLRHAVETLRQIDVVLIAHGTLPDQSTCESQVNVAVDEFNINATSTIALLTLLAEQMMHQRCGTLAVISSVAGDRGRPTNYLYGASKAAVTTFCEGLRARLFKVGVHVLTVKPGFVDTPMTKGLPLPQVLVAKPETVAASIVKAIDARRNVLYTPGFWALIMLIIRLLPRFVFKRINL